MGKRHCWWTLGAEVVSMSPSFFAKQPEAEGRLILQDQSETVQVANVPDSIKRMPHDFFTPQPVIGVRACFLDSILHNWHDGKARDILTNLKPAMRKGYSKVLIEDIVLSGESWALSRVVDMRISWNLGAGERSERKWRTLICSVGLKVTKIWNPLSDGASIIELELL